MEPFIVGVDITDVNKLCGRKRQIDILTSCAKRKGNAGIIGARRFGKTCLLKSLENYLRFSDESCAYPVYFDVKTQTGIKKDSPAVYRSMAALLASKMCDDGLLQEGDFKISRRCTLDVSDDKLDMLVQMKDWNPEYQKEALFFLADKVAESGKYVLLLLDEIDYLLLEALESPSDFSRIRGAATEKSCNLKFWVAGTSTWSSICTTIGSPELNCGLENVSLPPLTKDDFEEMWKQECSLFDDEEQRGKFLSIGETIYRHTGGIPYYAKFVGSHMINNGTIEIPDYQIIRDYLAEIVNNRFTSDVERSVLFLLSSGEKTFEDTIPDGVSGLLSKGLIKVDGNVYSIGIGYLLDYLTARKQDTSVSDDAIDIEKKERDSLVDEIARLRDCANNSYATNKPFIATTKDTSYFNVMKKPCLDEGALTAFATSVCILYYEGSETGKRLPSDFYTHEFCYMIRALRNKYDHSDHSYEARQMDDDKLFLIVNDGIVPFTLEHYKSIQSKVLNYFRDELLLMIERAPQKKKNIKKSNQVSVPSCSKNLENGKYYEGVVVEVNNQYGTFLNVKCNLYPYPLQVKSKREEIFENDKVSFKAVSEPNWADPNKLFWKADDVHRTE